MPTVIITIIPIGKRFISELMYEIRVKNNKGIHHVMVKNNTSLALTTSATEMGKVE
tara:strand:+ start:388 stop:555 length:168 start_codon:yes stop_codon:yes gene_type:complete